MEKIEIKKIGLPDIVQLKSIGQQTFFESFAARNTEENMQKYLDEAFSIEKLTSELTNPNAQFYVALFENKFVGYLKINFRQMKTDRKVRKALEIERIYVLNAFQGKQIGQSLYDKAFDIAKKIKAEYIWLGVWKENTKAINFYEKNGFIEAGKHTFQLGNEKQTGFVMVLEMGDGA
jgi:diamine N-acetyltransferase